jgi:hypothetical protein
MSRKPISTMTTVSDSNCKLHYLDLMKKSVKNYLANTFDESDFTPDDLMVIEYELKDCSRQSVSCDLSQQECAHLFAQRVKRLAEGNTEEWVIIRQRVTCCIGELTHDKVLDFDHLARSCQMKKK